jgi:hypothetical protein
MKGMMSTFTPVSSYLVVICAFVPTPVASKTGTRLPVLIMARWPLSTVIVGELISSLAPMVCSSESSALTLRLL